MIVVAQAILAFGLGFLALHEQPIERAAVGFDPQAEPGADGALEAGDDLSRPLVAKSLRTLSGKSKYSKPCRLSCDGVCA